MSSPSNTLNNIVDGLTVTLSAVTTAPVNVSVVPDKEAMKKTVTDFAAAYTAVVQLIANDTKYNSASETGGILQGDSSAVGLQRQLRNLVSGTSAASTVFTTLSSVGLQIQRDGSLTVNTTTLDNALSNLPELKKVFSNVNPTDPTQDGFATRFRTVTTAMLSTTGSLTTRTEGLNQEIERNQKNQDSLNVRLAAIEKRMRAQYTALDATMAKLNGVSSFVTQQINAFNAAGSSNH